MDRKNVYIFMLYYSPVYGAEESIKFEINFADKLIYPITFENIAHLFDDELVRDLEFMENLKLQIDKNICCYDLREIAAEKFRAILTRTSIKERDMLDLFLISKKINMEEIKKDDIIEKIISSMTYIKKLDKKIKNNLEALNKGQYGIIEEKSKFSLIVINEKEYSDFITQIAPLLNDIGEITLEKLEQKSYYMKQNLKKD